MNKYKEALKNLLSETSIKINGTFPSDLQVHNDKFYKRVLTNGPLGLGESYMEGWWECQRLDQLLYKLFIAGIEEKVKTSYTLQWMILKARIFDQQSKSKALKSIGSHYNIGNDLYTTMLDPLMNYSCGYWQKAKNLAQAQEHKLELICQKLKLQPGQKILDIGCGWGGFAHYAAKNYGVEVVGVTISEEQYHLASKRCKGLPIEIRLQDYRDIHGIFDRIVSIGMLEHVGPKNYSKFMGVITRNLCDDGICLLHFIGGNKSSYTTNPWTDKYIFPNGVIPSMVQIGKAMENKLVLQDWHNFGLYYDPTLMAWCENFKKAWPKLKQNYDNIFYRMWEFYLCSSAAAFRAKKLNLWQLVITKKEFPALYSSIRPTNFTS